MVGIANTGDPHDRHDRGRLLSRGARVQVVIEDYVHREWLKLTALGVALRLPARGGRGHLRGAALVPGNLTAMPNAYKIVDHSHDVVSSVRRSRAAGTLA